MPDRSIFFVWRYLLARFFHLIFAHGLNQIWPTANFQNRDVWLRACVTDTIDVSHRLRHLSEPSGTHPVPQSRQFPALVLIRTFKGGSLRLSGDGVCAGQTGRAGSGRHSPFPKNQTEGGTDAHSIAHRRHGNWVGAGRCNERVRRCGAARRLWRTRTWRPERPSGRNSSNLAGLKSARIQPGQQEWLEQWRSAWTGRRP